MDGTDIWAVEKALRKDGLMLKIPIRSDYIPGGGVVYAQLRATAPDGRVKKSGHLALRVKSSVNAVKEASSPLTSEFEAYEARMAALRNEVEAMLGEGLELCQELDFSEGWQFSKDLSTWETVSAPHT